jgi:hypothetical protein
MTPARGTVEPVCHGDSAAGLGCPGPVPARMGRGGDPAGHFTPVPVTAGVPAAPPRLSPFRVPSPPGAPGRPGPGPAAAVTCGLARHDRIRAGSAAQPGSSGRSDQRATVTGSSLRAAASDSGGPPGSAARTVTSLRLRPTARFPEAESTLS